MRGIVRPSRPRVKTRAQGRKPGGLRPQPYQPEHPTRSGYFGTQSLAELLRPESASLRSLGLVGGKTAGKEVGEICLCRLAKEGLEARLLEMVITSQCLDDPLVTHDDEGDAVGQRPVLVGPGAIK